MKACHDGVTTPLGILEEEVTNEPKTMLSHLDLFSGIGGFSLAAKQLGGIRTTQFVEINPNAQLILRHHFPQIPIHSDIRDYHPRSGQFDIITMGFPCTGTSNAGKRTGLSHPESALWREGIRCILEAQSKFCIIEQPEGFIERGLRTILATLYMAGYSFEVETVSAQELGAGHQRFRLFIISYPDEWANIYNNAPCWSDQMREMVQRQRADSEWLTVKRRSDRSDYGFPVGLVRSALSVPTSTPGRIRARYLAGRTVTPGQAAVALRRVLYLDSLSGQTTQTTRS
ncbi:DNA cytosine methyltransferase [Pleurocapsales cyanobacterium LEGE 06147]|nr:DNA cytosine methyltransferase [Pleurocapsales cyanobacterium LEGE 06147]